MLGTKITRMARERLKIFNAEGAENAEKVLGPQITQMRRVRRERLKMFNAEGAEKMLGPQITRITQRAQRGEEKVWQGRGEWSIANGGKGVSPPTGRWLRYLAMTVPARKKWATRNSRREGD